MTFAFIGFGEAAQAFAQGCASGKLALMSAYDVKTSDPGHRVNKLADYDRYAVVGAESLSDLLPGAPPILSLVTADQALSDAEAAAPLLTSRAPYCVSTALRPTPSVRQPTRPTRQADIMSISP